MDPERWRRIQDVFHAAADLAPAERVAFLAAAGNNDVADDVRALLAADAQGDSLLDRDLGEVASRILADADIERGSRIGPYVLRARLGEGGMGVVYLAERTDLKSLVAIKLLRDAWLSPARRERFAVEQRALAQLNHPSIARLYDADTLPDGTPWFAMEYVDGVPLTRYAATNALSLSRLLDLFRAVGEAVRHAHQHAVIHRDLKPSNILVTRGGQPKLLDFGIAKELEGLDAEATWTRPELRLWTPGYAAPEQVEGRPQGVHTDVYGLGAILYEVLTGRPPQSQAPDRPSLAGRTRLDARGVSWSDLDVLCLTALHPDPARRYRSVESLLRDLDHLVREEPLEARPDTWDYRVSKFVRRRWRPLALTAAIALGLVAVVSFYTLRLATARNQAVDEAARAQRIQAFMTGLFEGGDPNAGPSDTLRVVELLERGERDARSLTDPQARADLFETLGGIQRTLGNLDRADSLLHMALLTRRAMPKAAADDPHLSRTLVEIGLLRTDQSRYDEADSLVRLGLGRMRRRVPRDAAAIARATQSLATVLENRGEYDEAIAILEQAAREDSAAGLPPAERAVTLTLLANNHFYAGHYALAESLNRVVLASDRKIHGPRHPSVASDLINLGAIEQEWGHWAEAEDYYRQALAIYRGWYGDRHFETAAALSMVGRTLVQQDRLDEGGAMLRRALAIREGIYGPVHPAVASTLNELALLAQNRKHYDEAERNFRRMIAIYEQVHPEGHYLVGLAHSNLGTLFILTGDYGAAERAFRRALGTYEATLPAGHLYFGITRIKLGRALLRARRYAESERELRGGLSILTAQAEPSERWIANVHTDLAQLGRALGQADSAKFIAAQ